MTVLGYPCLTNDLRNSRILWVDPSSGKLVDMDVLERANAAAFHADGSSMDPALRAEVDAASDSDLIDVSVWYWVDESDLPDKDALLADDQLQVKTQQLLDQRIHAGAVALANSLSSITGPLPQSQGSQVLSSLDASIKLGAPLLSVRATKGILRELGRDPNVVWMGEVPRNEQPASEAYYSTTNQWILQSLFGYNGSGITVAVVEGAAPDAYATLNGGPFPGNCAGDNPSDTGLCYCPNSNPYFFWDAHPRWVGGMIRNSSTSFLGMANGARLLFANWGNGSRCAGPDTYALAVAWAVNRGAAILNNSFGGGVGNPQDATARLTDYIAIHFPWALAVFAAGSDGLTAVTRHQPYNGLVVGGSDNAATAATQAMFNNSANFGSDSKNWAPGGGNSANYFEVPHIVAPAVNTDTAPHHVGDPSDYPTGTSQAAPQIAGIAAALDQINSNLVERPEVLIPGFLVGADVNVDRGICDPSCGVWPLNLNDGVDDKDGAGLVDAWVTANVLGPGSKVDGGNSPAQFGHDYNTITPSSFTSGIYDEAYNASVPNGTTLRAAVLFTATPTCGSPPAESNCTSSAYPLAWAAIQDSPGHTIAWSTPNYSNYALVSYKNTSGVTKTYTIYVLLPGWNGLSQAYMGFAWASSPQVQ